MFATKTKVHGGGEKMETRLLVLYTGGTIGIKVHEGGE